jgi:hypothetical protein
VESRLFLLVLRETPRNRARVITDHPPEQIEIPECYRREDVMPGAAFDEEIDNVATGLTASFLPRFAGCDRYAAGATDT